MSINLVITECEWREEYSLSWLNLAEGKVWTGGIK